MNEMQSTKSLLAKLLASEDIRVEHGNFQTASFDVKNRVIRLPIFKYMSGPIYDLMVLHEVGHALYTPLKGLHSEESDRGSGFKSYLNVVEDARIEKKIKRKYPGGAKPMIEGYRELVREDFFGTSSLDMNTLNLIDRINLHYKIGASALIEFDPEEREFIHEMDHAETFDEVYDITCRLYDYAKENESQTDFQDFSMMSDGSDSSDDWDEQPEMMGDSPFEWMEDEDTEESDGDKGMRGSSHESEENPEESGEGEDGENSEGNSEEDSSSSNPEMSDVSGDNESAGGISSGLEGGVSGDESFEPRSMTDEAWQESAKDLNANDSDKVYEYITIPKCDLKGIVVDHKKLAEMTYEFYNNERMQDSSSRQTFYEVAHKMVKDFKSKNMKTVDYLVKEFEMRKKADEYKRTATANTGLLDMSSIHSYKFSDNLFKKVASVATGKNHGLVMFMDWSGSMSQNLAGTLDQLFNLVLFCRKVNIPFEVYAFTDRNLRDWVDSDRNWTNELGELVVNQNLHLLNLFSNSMTISQMNFAMASLMMVKMRYDQNYYYNRWSAGIPHYFDLGGTPLDATILASLELIPEFQKKNRVQIVNAVFLTDGESHTSCEVYRKNEQGFKTTTHFSSRGGHTFYVDPVTKKSYKTKRYNRGSSTEIFYKILKDRLGVNVLGFYLIGRKFTQMSRDIAWSSTKGPQIDEVLRTWRKDKSYICTDYQGYDKLYYIKDGTDLQVQDEGLTVKEDATKGQLTRAFKNFSKKKLTNRVVLKSFAEMVA